MIRLWRALIGLESCLFVLSVRIGSSFLRFGRINDSLAVRVRLLRGASTPVDEVLLLNREIFVLKCSLLIQNMLRVSLLIHLLRNLWLSVRSSLSRSPRLLLPLLYDVVDHRICVVWVDKLKISSVPLPVRFFIFFNLYVVLERLKHLCNWHDGNCVASEAHITR